MSEAQLKRLKKAELVELAELQGIDASGTKADILPVWLVETVLISHKMFRNVSETEQNRFSL